MCAASYQRIAFKMRASAPIKFIHCTGEEDKDFDGFVVLPPAVRVFAVHGEAGELPCVCTGGVDQRQHAVSLMLGHPVNK